MRQSGPAWMANRRRRTETMRPLAPARGNRIATETSSPGPQTGGQSVLDISIPELVQTGSTFGSWPLNLPPAASEQFVTLNVPYRFFGVTEQLSFLAQWAGQGFEDLSALANLILLQATMLGEEYQLISGSSASLSTPA